MVKIIIAFLVGFSLASFLTGLINGEGGFIGTPLTVPMTATAVIAEVEDTTGFASSGYLMIESETVTYTGKNATEFIGITRGVDSTTVAYHPLISQGTRVMVYTENAGGVNKALGFDAAAIMSNNGLIGIPVIAWDFMTITMPMIIAWDCLSWMTGDLAIVRTILIIITLGLWIGLAIAGLANIVKPK
jgi:hypothetical protein